jgi:hypothetical protein
VSMHSHRQPRGESFRSNSQRSMASFIPFGPD